jgi:hypothetical protein
VNKLSNEQATAGAVEPTGIVDWLLAILQVVNAGGKLAPEKAVTKALHGLINTYGAERVWEGIKQLSLTFRIADVSSAEALFHNHPDLPELLKRDQEARKALNGWFAQHSALVTRFHKISSGMLRLSPVVEWRVEPLPDTGKDLRSLTDFLFHEKEGTQ